MFHPKNTTYCMFASQSSELPFSAITELILQPHCEVGMAFSHIKLPLSYMYMICAVSTPHFYFSQLLMHTWDKLTISFLWLFKSLDKSTLNEFLDFLKHDQGGQTSKLHNGMIKTFNKVMGIVVTFESRVKLKLSLWF